MSNLLIAFLATIGASAYIYTKFQRHTGNNTKQAIIGTSLLAVFIFIFLIFILSYIPTGK
jgi:hypothetical protein